MLRLLRAVSCCSVLVVLFSASPGHAGSFISSAVKVSGNATPIQLLDGGLFEGVAAYVDRTHALTDIPAGLEGADFVQVSNDDKSSDPYQVDVTIDQPTLLYVGLDNRITDGDASTPAVPLPWMLDTSQTGLGSIFYDTGVDISIDESADGSIDNAFSMFVALAPGGTYSLLQQNDGGGRNMYIIAANRTLVVPEPASLTLLGLAGMCLAGLRRRRV